VQRVYGSAQKIKRKSEIPALMVRRGTGEWRTSILESSGRSALMRKILFLICVLGIPCASWSQTNQASWANLSTLRAGQKIQVVEMNSKKHSGTFVNVSDTAIWYKEAAGEQAIQRHDVRSVKLMENKHRLRNTLIGGAVGAGAGAGIGAAWQGHLCRGRRGDRFRRGRSRRSSVSQPQHDLQGEFVLAAFG
jgi:hypothetical protein